MRIGLGLGLLLGCAAPSELEDDVCRSFDFDQETCLSEGCQVVSGTQVLGDCRQPNAFAECIDEGFCSGPLVPHRDDNGICWLIAEGCLDDRVGWSVDDSCPDAEVAAELPICAFEDDLEDEDDFETEPDFEVDADFEAFPRADAFPRL